MDQSRDRPVRVEGDIRLEQNSLRAHVVDVPVIGRGARPGCPLRASAARGSGRSDRPLRATVARGSGRSDWPLRSSVACPAYGARAACATGFAARPGSDSDSESHAAIAGVASACEVKLVVEAVGTCGGDRRPATRCCVSHPRGDHHRRHSGDHSARTPAQPAGQPAYVSAPVSMKPLRAGRSRWLGRVGMSLIGTHFGTTQCNRRRWASPKRELTPSCAALERSSREDLEGLANIALDNAHCDN